MSFQFGERNEKMREKVNCKTLVVARNNCRLFQLIFDSDHNFHDHCSHSHSHFDMQIYTELQKQIHVVE